jgi:hypothetical protein
MVVIDAVAVVRLVNKTTDAVDVVVVRTVEVAFETWRLQAALMTDAGKERAARVCGWSARFAGTCVKVATKVVVVEVLTTVLTAGTMVERMVLVRLTITVAVELGASKPSSVEQNP